MEKVVNPTFPKNNLFHQVYSMTTFEVVFSHPLGLTEDFNFICSVSVSKKCSGGSDSTGTVSKLSQVSEVLHSGSSLVVSVLH